MVAARKRGAQTNGNQTYLQDPLEALNALSHGGELVVHLGAPVLRKVTEPGNLAKRSPRRLKQLGQLAVGVFSVRVCVMCISRLGAFAHIWFGTV